jgi:hypothetical protein
MQWLHDHGAKEDATSHGNGQTRMMLSSGENNVEAMQWLFDHGSHKDVRRANSRGETPMWYAGSAKTMQWLYDHSAKDHVRMASIDGTVVIHTCQSHCIVVLTIFKIQNKYFFFKNTDCALQVHSHSLLNHSLTRYTYSYSYYTS